LFYTVEEVARYLQLKVRTVQHLASKGEIPGAVQVGRQWRFERAALETHVGRKLPEPSATAETES
jgi:excisionase family DNA binding protein